MGEAAVTGRAGEAEVGLLRAAAERAAMTALLVGAGGLIAVSPGPLGPVPRSN